ncbi:MAG TPA: hypothetical protein VK467_00300 [Gemmatimonadales bacterium]|nr:hypothetical protein [Gemmatimonadales bacterium]
MSWWIAGLIAGVVAFLVDYVMWGKVFTKGMDAFAVMPAPGQPMNMGPMLMKSAVLSLLFGLFLAFAYRQLMGSLWVTGGGWLAGMEFAAVLWLPIAFQTTGGAVWYTKVKALFDATCWAWLARMLAAGLVVGWLM